MNYVRTAKDIYKVDHNEIYMVRKNGDITVGKWIPLSRVKIVDEADDIKDLIDCYIVKQNFKRKRKGKEYRVWAHGPYKPRFEEGFEVYGAIMVEEEKEQVFSTTKRIVLKSVAKVINEEGGQFKLMLL